MPEGPFGFPRVTDIGPFSEVGADQEFQKQTSTGYAKGYTERVISSAHGVDFYQVEQVSAKLVVRAKIEDSDDTILGEIKRQVEVATRNKIVADIKYWYDSVTGVAGIITVDVGEPFRNMGIATQLKEQEMEYMGGEGIDLIYTDIVSEGGYRLAKKTGFRPIYELNGPREIQQEFGFNNSSNRGHMFRTL